MSLIVRALRGGERRADFGDSSIPPNSLAGSSSLANGGMNTAESALALMDVYACVSILADAVSTLPVQEFQGQGDRRRPVDPSPLVLEPWSEISRQDWLTQVMVSLLLRGNFYGLIAERDRLGYPTQVMPYHPDDIRVRRNRETGAREYRVSGKLVDSSTIFHIPGMTMPGGVAGLNPIAYARQGLALAQAQEQFGSKFFENGAHTSGVVSVAGDFDDDEILAVANQFNATHTGVANAHLPVVLSGGATYTPISVSPEDAQFLQSRQYQRVQIAGFFRVPPHKLGEADKSTVAGAGLEQYEMGFVVDSLMPWLGRIESQLTRVRPVGTYAKFNLKGRLRGDTLQRYQAYLLARNAKFLNIDEIRALEDMPPLPDGEGQDYFAPLGTNPAPNGAGSAPGAPGGQEDPAGLRSFDARLVELLLEPRSVTAEIHVPAQAPVVNVAPAEVRVNVEPTVVNVPAPNVRVAAPVVNVATPEVRVDVAAPPVHIAPPAPVHIHVPEPKPVARRIIRDREGRPTGIVEE